MKSHFSEQKIGKMHL